MNYFERTRLYLFIIIILAIFNISAIVAIIYHIRSEHKFARTENREEGRDRGKHFAQRIGFDTIQAVQFDSLKADFGRKTKAVMVLIQEKKLEMMNEFASETPDTAKLYRLTVEIGSLHAQIRHLSIDHFMSVKKMCNPDQKAKFLEMFRNMMKMEEGPGFSRRHGGDSDKKPFVQEGMLF